MFRDGILVTLHIPQWLLYDTREPAQYSVVRCSPLARMHRQRTAGNIHGFIDVHILTVSFLSAFSSLFLISYPFGIEYFNFGHFLSTHCCSSRVAWRPGIDMRSFPFASFSFLSIFLVFFYITSELTQLLYEQCVIVYPDTYNVMLGQG